MFAMLFPEFFEFFANDPDDVAGFAPSAPAHPPIIFSLVIGIASRNVCIGVLPKHQRP
jgi:hypothetical protein